MTREELIQCLEAWRAEDPDGFLEHELTGEIISLSELVAQVRAATGLGERLFRMVQDKPDPSLN